MLITFSAHSCNFRKLIIFFLTKLYIRYGYLNLSSIGIHKVEMICKKDVVSLSSNIFEYGLSGTA